MYSLYSFEGPELLMNLLPSINLSRLRSDHIRKRLLAEVIINLSRLRSDRIRKRLLAEVTYTAVAVMRPRESQNENKLCKKCRVLSEIFAYFELF